MRMRTDLKGWPFATTVHLDNGTRVGPIFTREFPTAQRFVELAKQRGLWPVS